MKIVFFFFFTLSFWRWIREPGLLILLNTQCIRIQVYKTLTVSLTPRLSSLDNLRLLTGAAVPLHHLTFQPLLEPPPWEAQKAQGCPLHW